MLQRSEQLLDKWPDLSYLFFSSIDCYVRINGEPDCLFSTWLYCINVKTFRFLAVYWSIRTSSYNTDIKVQPFLNGASTMLNNHVFKALFSFQCSCISVGFETRGAKIKIRYKNESPIRGGTRGGGHSNYFLTRVCLTKPWNGGLKSWLQAQNIGSLELHKPWNRSLGGLRSGLKPQNTWTLELPKTYGNPLFWILFWIWGCKARLEL